jgi:hypothetical protein
LLVSRSLLLWEPSKRPSRATTLSIGRVLRPHPTVFGSW